MNRMKIKNNIWILIVVVALVVAIVVSNKFGINIWPILVFAAGVVLVYGIIDGIINKFADAFAKKRAVGNEEINAKIELIMQRMQVIESKVDKINTILEKVSD
jgi:hypothetical protein